eukprot:CAMPEP_0194219412 /NCGR_PEP_ID=MMETSP0156-20130528/25910_1 /TAXON_ID=33649 /ORGANISM="Thalassionema nitzschioides, Strain L26-B" /LENGTH=485 /DNA_ID=CAMNT_0038949065 /DNA_START=197 /DNA_END=1650 /DNA_ORIENTATION=+
MTTSSEQVVVIQTKNTTTHNNNNNASSSKKYKILLLIFTALYVTFFFGAFFGYGPMILMLKEAGAFPCPENDNDCSDQTRTLLNVHFTATLVQILSPLAGHLYDVKGPMITIIYTTVMAILGISLLAISQAVKGIDALLYPAFCCLAMVPFSPMIVATGAAMGKDANNDSSSIGIVNGEEENDESSSHDDNKDQRRVVGLLNNLFDAGSVTYLILWKTQEATGASFPEITLGYLGVAIFFFGGAIIFWKLFLNSQQQKKRDTNIALDNDTNDTESCPAITPEQPADLNLQKRQDWKKLRSAPFIWLVVFFVFHTCRNYFMLTSAEAFLDNLGDDSNKYITIFTSIMPASIVGFPFVDWMLGKYGYHVGLQAINVLGLLHGIIQVSTTNLNVQIVGFVVFSFYRSFMFSVVFAYLMVLLSEGNVVGKANGILYVSSGLCSLWNIPLGNVTMQQWGGNFFVPNLIYTIGILPFFYAAYRTTGKSTTT